MGSPSSSPPSSLRQTGVAAILATMILITDGQPYSFLPPLDPNLPQPQILTAPQVFRAEVGDSLVLPCQVRDLGPMVLIWKKGTRVLTAGEMKVRRDDRIDLKGTSLVLESVGESDGGEYSCEIEADQEYPVAITHQIEVLIPPSLKVDPSDRRVVVRAGATVALRCRADAGNPPPEITWRKVNDRLPPGAVSEEDDVRRGATLTMAGVSRHHSGDYACAADNGVGRPAGAQIALNVLFEPEVKAEHPVVHGGLGRLAELSCLVYADPAADVVWYRDTMRLDPNGSRYMESRGSRHTLILREVQREDFANYSCYAANTLGKARDYLTLRGNPNAPRFNSQLLSKSRTSYKISWTTESFAPIDEYRLLYRKIPVDTPAGQRGPTHPTAASGSSSLYPGAPRRRTPTGPASWNSLRLPVGANVPEGPKANIYREAYSLGGLVPDSSYEAKVSALNEYGWSGESPVFQFYTQGRDTPPDPKSVRNPDSPADDPLMASSSLDANADAATSNANRIADASILFLSVLLGLRLWEV